MAGGSSALLASVLGATDATDAMRRVAYVQRLVQTGAADAQTPARTRRRPCGPGPRRCSGPPRPARRPRPTCSAGTTSWSRPWPEASAELAQLSERASGLAAAEAAAARVAALNAAVAASGEARVATARASDVVPANYQRLYVAAAKTCRNMSWTLLAAIGQVETGHGANTSSSYAGAQGPMQFMPATFATYGVDGDGDGDRDISDPADAVFSAAHYLCANGAGRSAEATARAVWHYNHADWYVALVLKLAGQYAERDGG